MYQSFYGLSEMPFNITPDPKFLYLSPTHQEALQHLKYGVQEKKGFIVLVGEVGCGKTTLCRRFLNELDAAHYDTALILNSRITEILLCYASAEEMMAGKIGGVGAAGLTQIAIWAAIAVGLAESSALVRHALADARIGAGMIAGFVVFYVLGYALYSAVFAAVGAAFNSQDEAQQWNFIIVLPLIAGSLMVPPAVSAPSSLAVELAAEMGITLVGFLRGSSMNV